LHGISTIYHRRCGLSLSGVTSAYSADELFDDAGDRPDVGRLLRPARN
jgi:hypothetical protein